MSTEEENPANSESRNDEFTNPDEDKAATAAALLLCSLKQPHKYPNRSSILDHEQTLALEEAVRIHKLKLNRTYRNLPPVSAIHNIIKECSQPFEKQLKESDLKRDQMRLLLKEEYVIEYLCPMLNDMEKVKIKKPGIKVRVYNFEGKIYEMIFKLWGTKAYVLTSKNWVNFYSDHNFVKDEDWVTLWMFRHVETSELCFVIVSERKALPSMDATGKKKISMNGSKKRRRNDQEENSSKKRRRNDQEESLN